MKTANYRQLVERYIEAYNQFDVEGMLVPLHKDVEFRNVANGEVNLATSGKASFRQQAEQATQYFSQREQRVTEWKVDNDQVEATIDYSAIAALDFPNGLKKGDSLRLSGQSIFRFADGQIIFIEDRS
ncbi:nuclear transport factor 2 family protein [Hymenobacter terrenus]|uniref:nuclear transport factor 2 family protein n=1 Tax=Hymenobacter terrenus TaxID=1629124 RepID=UPI000619A48B|nr:nuclear transport factor 2 family protein [Hymenobacter terrenus]